MALFSLKTLRKIGLTWLFCVAIQHFLTWKSYSIGAKDFKAIASNIAREDMTLSSAVFKLAKDLRDQYGEKILTKAEWQTFSAGGLHLRVLFLYGDFTEYIAVLAPVGNSIGTFGVHWANSTCAVMNGFVWRTPDVTGIGSKVENGRGQIFYHGQFDHSIYEFSTDAVVACYGRGFMPTSSFWIVVGSIANGDPWSAVRILYSYSKMNLANMARPFVENYRLLGEWLKKMAKENWTKAEL